METYKEQPNKQYNSPHEIEKNLDRLIMQRMRGESSFSPFKYSPKYQEDQFSRLILQGNRKIVNANPYKPQGGNFNPYLGDQYFGNIQHQYLNQQNYYDRIWNINHINNAPKPLTQEIKKEIREVTDINEINQVNNLQAKGQIDIKLNKHNNLNLIEDGKLDAYHKYIQGRKDQQNEYE
jgi:hypothetical protein